MPHFPKPKILIPMHPSPRQIFSLIAGLLVLAVAGPGRGAVLGFSSLNSDGSYTYSYIVDNTAGAFDISSWSLEFDFLTPDWNQLDVPSGGDVAVPSPDWFASAGIPTTGSSAQDFLSLSPLSDVLLGASLSGFAFTSQFAPGVVGFNEFDAFGLDANSGTTVGPSTKGGTPVPEGAGHYEVIAGLMLAGFAAATRRWNNRSRTILV